MKRTLERQIPDEFKSPQADSPIIFGLRYLEEEAAEIHDVVGCRITATPNYHGSNTNPPGSCTDDSDEDY
ncbi:MAG TPA: herpeto-tandem family RiPP [Ktedonosporobacter sp.]|nr:herpeto-tandem family RiPP [Ktedonosporobacter sp.]